MMPTISLKEAMKRGYVFPNVQTVLFSKDKFNRKSSTKWLKDHGYPAKYYRTTKNFIRRMIHSPVENAKYYTIQLPKNIQLVYQYFDDIDGAGLKEIFQKVKTKATEFIERVAPLRKAGILPPKSRQLLERIGDDPITTMQIIRTPIESYINKALNLLSLNKWDQVVKQMGYDKLFHLSIFLNNKYVFHKIEVPTLSQETPIKSNSEIKNVNISSLRNNSISKFIDETRKYMGGENFSRYDPAYLNCQHFITAALSANNVITPELNKFINQDAIQIFQKLPKYVKDVATTITEAGARFNRAIQGEGVNTLLTKVKRKLNLLKIPYTEVALSNKPTKKIMVVINGKRIHFGAKNSNTFLEGATKQKRDNYRKRHSLIYLKDGRRAIDVKYSPAYLSYYVLW